MALTFEKTENRYGPCIEITGYEGRVTFLKIPSKIQGLPVRSIGRHAFDGRKDLKEVRLPDSVRSLGSFCFYNTRSLEYLSLSDSVEDYHDGAIRQCTGLKEIRIDFRKQDNFAILKSMLGDNEKMLRFLLALPEGDLRLTFPPYYDSYKEDTMARAIHHSLNGAGFSYRECVMRRSIDFRTYDRCFSRVIYDNYQAAIDIALDRLMYPVQLPDQAALVYERYLTQTADQVLPFLLGRKDAERIRFLTGRKMIPREALPEAVRIASEGKQAEICALLMEYQNRYFGLHAGAADALDIFSLDDL